MTQRLKTIGAVFVGAFFLWHAFSVATYAIPVPTQNAAAIWVRNHAISLNRWYMLGLSQWQQWNLFSPDPMRRVPSYDVQRETSPGTWETVASITPDSFSWWQQTTRYKMLIGALETDQESYTPLLVNHFLTSYCAPINLPAGTPLRLRYHPYVVSYSENMFEAMRPDPWPPAYIDSFSEPVTCP